MTDVHTPAQRSKNMAAIKGKNTKPEVYLRKQLFANGYRYSIANKRIPGHPDIFLRKYNTAIFVHGCFWHRHKNCKYASSPKSNVEFWENKFNANIKRDATVQAQLLDKKIKCLIVWECNIRHMKKDEDYKAYILNEIESFLTSEVLFQEI